MHAETAEEIREKSLKAQFESLTCLHCIVDKTYASIVYESNSRSDIERELEILKEGTHVYEAYYGDEETVSPEEIPEFKAQIAGDVDGDHETLLVMTRRKCQEVTVYETQTYDGQTVDISIPRTHY